MLPIDRDGIMKKVAILSKQFKNFEWTNVVCGLSGDCGGLPGKKIKLAIFSPYIK